MPLPFLICPIKCLIIPKSPIPFPFLFCYLFIPYFCSLQILDPPPMKRQAAADQFPFQGTLKTVPKIAVTLIATALVLSLVISLNSPSSYFRYINPAKISHQSTPATFDSQENSTGVSKTHEDAEFEATKPQDEIRTITGAASSIQNNDLPVAKELHTNSSSSSWSGPNQEKDTVQSEEISSETSESKWPEDPVTQKTPEQTDEIVSKKKNSGRTVTGQENCDLFSGKWVPNPEAPYYTNATCYRIQDHQNCMKYGRPDTGYSKWKWKPDGCELPTFDPHQFLQLLRGKSIAFVGDSVGRNHMQSLMCLLSSVVYPLDLSPSDISQKQHWVYKDYNFNISMFWTPYLVRSEITNPNDVTSPYNLYLDEFDEDWTAKVEGYNYIIISAAQWFFRPTLFYQNGTLIGCNACKKENVTQLSTYFGYEKTFRTAFRAINSLKNFKGVTFLRTITPSHFEGGVWDKGGDCVRTRPFKRNETVLEDYNSELRRIQLQELGIAQEEGSKRGLRFRLLDATQAMLLRPDGHPSKYGHWPREKVTNDCVHWCLPGPIDALSDLLLELIRREEVQNS